MSEATRDRSAHRTLDWEAAHVQLERARRLLQPGSERPPGEARRILEARAQDLARPPAAGDQAGETLDVLVCRLGEERFGLDLAHVLEVAVAVGLTPVPCTPPFVLGVVSHRGRILAVVDFRVLFEPAAEPARAGLVVAVDADGMEVGIAADEVHGVVRVSAAEIAPPTGPPAGGRDRIVRGVTADLVSVLDLEALARHPRLEVKDEVG